MRYERSDDLAGQPRVVETIGGCDGYLCAVATRDTRFGQGVQLLACEAKRLSHSPPRWGRVIHWFDFDEVLANRLNGPVCVEGGVDWPVNGHADVGERMSNERLSQYSTDEGVEIMGLDVKRSRGRWIDEPWPAHLTNHDDIGRAKTTCELGRENAAEMEADRIKKAAHYLNHVIDEASEIVRPRTLHDDSELTLADENLPLRVRE